MKNELIKLIESKSPGSIPLYLVIRGSHAYGTNVPTSDTDYSGIFVQNLDSILGMSYVEQINDDKNDIVIYEIRRFLELLAKNNPTVLELLNTPEDCIIYKHPLFDSILENRDKFLTKICANSFGGYAKEQIGKAKGQNKKQNWEKDKVTRKTPLDFCYLHQGEKSVSLVEYLESRNLDQKFAGLSKVPHSKDTYAMFYDYYCASMYSEKSGKIEKKISKFINNFSPYKSMRFKGISFEDSNDIKLSSIPLDCPNHYFVGYISYNKDGYTQHCKDYKSYETWLEQRNDQRWVDVESHGQKIDGKNMMHCRRLMDMAREIAEGKGIVVRRANAQELIDIRQGKVDLQTLIDHVESEIKEIDLLYKNSTLPDNVDMNLVEQILINIRKKIYNVCN
jgi:predicted nucleotidyltransferase